ncbi:MAG: hypothetical protein COT55_00650 [Candidatus Diapherotrites archaeon CG09_land_8_20_14_0_10_32_12]|nr:MAG: hypothetical protein COT55_00650 [Candidatus Diapherotrites archaeon CG09_land_8_20_14_0_10_32_12]
MNLNVSLGEYLEKIITRAIEKGLAKTKTQVIRLAILHFGKEYGLNEPSLEESKESKVYKSL